MRNLRNEVRRIVQEEMNTHNTRRMLVTEIGDGSAKPYQFTPFNAKLRNFGSANVEFKTDSGLVYKVYIKNMEMYLNVSFTSNDTYDVTNKGEMYRVMSTLIAIIEGVFKKTELKGIMYFPYAKGNDGGKGRDTLYRLFITSFAKKHRLKVEFNTSKGFIVYADLFDPTGKFLRASLRTKLLSPSWYKIRKKDLIVDSDLDLSETNIVTLPAGLKVKGGLNLSYCTSLKSLPKDLQVDWSLTLTGCTSLKSLPNGLQIYWGLYLEDCTSLTSLPDGLEVGELNLNGCTSLKSLPNDLKVGGNMYLKNTPIADAYNEDEIRDMIEASGGYVKRYIYI